MVAFRRRPGPLSRPHQRRGGVQLNGLHRRRHGLPTAFVEAVIVVAAKRTDWSQRVTETSDALDLDPGVFTLEDPRRIARSLKRSAERSRRRKADPFQSAMSMLTFYINRAGKQLPETQRARLEAAKDELRDLFGKPRCSSR